MWSAATSANAALKIAPSTPDAAKIQAAATRSSRFDAARISAPATNPNWTESVSHDVSATSACHSRESCGITAVPENHSDFASSSASAMKQRTLARETGLLMEI